MSHVSQVIPSKLHNTTMESSSAKPSVGTSPNPLLSLPNFIHRLGTQLATRLDDTKRLAAAALPSFRPPPPSSLPFASMTQRQGKQTSTTSETPLNSDHVARRLVGTSVYTVSNTDNEFVLLSDPDGVKSVGLLCFRKEDAESFLAQVRSRRGELRGGAKVVPITLDQVYMLKVEGIAFRFLPDPVQIKNALELRASATRSGFDGVPVFQSDLLVVRKKNKRYCPIYFQKEDIEKALSAVSRVSRGPSVSQQHITVGSLEDVLKKMEMSEKNSGWEDLIFIPPGKKENGIKLKILEETKSQKSLREVTKSQKPSFLKGITGKGTKIGTLNMDDEDFFDWNARIISVSFDRVSDMFKWKDIFPEWIDEEEEYSGPSCPDIPMPDFEKHDDEYVDMIVAKLPCRFPEEGWNRDVFRLQVHLAAAKTAVKRGRWDRDGRMNMVFLSECMPMVEIFRCDEMVGREGDWWYYRVEMGRLEKKVGMPLGSCSLAMPLWDKGINQIYDVSKIKATIQNPQRREAYATVLHSSESYVCGAITLAQSLLRTQTRRDLLLLLDTSISEPKRLALARAGWTLRFIKRIRNPRAEKNSYNEYNYSKFRLWQLTGYEKIIFIDSDIIVLRNLDILFHFPQMSATGNDGSIFNSGIMVIEPSNCTFRTLMKRRDEIISYNGGDQGFLNEVFVYWHRLPRRVNFLKNFWSNSSIEAGLKNQLFGSDPPKLYSIHYLGLKPWNCYRDYDCNWNVEDQRVYASDQAHARWWKVHDAMDGELQKLCGLTKRRRIELEWDRKAAREMGFKDQHWRINVTDPRKFI